MDDSTQIRAVPTSVAAFVGNFESGPVNEAVSLTNAADAEAAFGLSGATLDSIRQFFDNGGQSCVAVRIDASAEDAVTALGAALTAFDPVDFNLLCVPGTFEMEASIATSIILAAETYCERERAFLIIDAPRVLKTPTDIMSWLQSNPTLRHSNAALYYPRVMVPDPVDKSQVRAVPVSGTIAGVMARFDRKHKLWTAPAGSEATLTNVKSLEYSLSKQESELLNQRGVNCLRNFPGQGPLVWGARTLSEEQELKYVPVRRLFLFIERSISQGLAWTIFEPNGEALWARVRNLTHAFLSLIWLLGGIKGATLKDAFFVKCDRTVMTPDDIANGRLNVLIGVAPTKPAEFVIFRIGLFTAEHDP